MHNSLPSKKRRSLCLAITLGSAGMPGTVVGQDPSEIEEVVVTGSYIRGSALDAPSPVTVVDRQNMQAQGAAVLWDVIRNLEVNQGSDTNIAGTPDAGQLVGTASVNLRNLGGNSTLTLINGKRFTPAAVVTSSGQEFVDLNAIPLTMTERVEVLTDGGSALYGSDAVAGVVNIIMRTEFEGLELYGDIGGIEEAGTDNERTISGIWGWGSDDGRTNFVLSAEYFERDPVTTEYSSWYSEDLTAYNGIVGSLGTPLPLGGSQVNPAYINQQLTAQKAVERSALGLSISGAAALTLSDPLCETLSGPAGPFYIDNRFADFGDPSGQCSEGTVHHSFIAVGAERLSLAGTFEHEFSDSVEFYSFFQHSDADTERQGDGRTRSRSAHYMLPPPGTAPPSPAQPIFALAELGAFAPVLGMARPTITNSPLSAANGGIGTAMFSTDIIATGWPREGNTLNTTNVTSGLQAGFRGEFEAADRVIGYDVSASWSYSSVEQSYLTLQRDRTELALQGLGGPNCVPNGVPDFDFTNPAVDPFGVWTSLSNNFNDIAFPGYILNLRETFSYALTSNNHGQGGCEFYNPFLTALTDPNLANSQELQDWMTQDILRADKQNKLLVIDAVINGELFEMGGGTAQFATGLQYRDRNAASIAPTQNQPGLRVIADYDLFGMPNEYFENFTNNLECSQCIFNFDHDRTVRAAFLELSLPFAENVETQVALRWEDYGENIGSELTPKVALSWRPIDELLLRGSFSQSFRAPNIGVVYEAFEAFGTTVQDPISNQLVRAGLLPPTNENAEPEGSFTVGSPNPNLGNESANTYSLGFQWTPGGDLQGLRIGADAWRFEVSDRVLPQVPRAAIQPQIDLFSQVAQDENNYILNTSYALDATPRFQKCVPSEVEAEFGRNSDERRNCVVDPRLYDIIPEIDRLAGDLDADLVTIVLPAVNAGNITVQGIDLKMGYQWDTDFGNFNVGLEYTHIDEYLVNDVPGLELGIQETGRFDAAGTDGEQAIVRSVPDNRGNIRFSWLRNNHAVTVFNRHIGSYEVLGHQDFIENPRENQFDIALAKPKIVSYDTWDIQYNYTHQWGNDSMGTTVFTVGVIDALDADVPLHRRQTFDQTVFDSRGRRWYARALWQF
ncbi:MAG: TonB-dependent receptor [Gammaproteobacteria bacterium]|nr:TonB-dependent receptor [Gammaproteobacteria bacterium]